MVGQCDDRYGHTIAIMVREDMAWAFVQYSADYLDQKARAKTDQLRLDTHRCVPPWGLERTT